MSYALRDVTVTMPSGMFGRFVVTDGVAIDDDLHRATVVLGDRITRLAGIVTYAFEPQLEPRSAADVVIAPSERTDAACGNGTDDDGDGASDCSDLDCCATVPCAGAVSSRRVILSEVLYDVTGADDGCEWVEIRNAGATAVPLACYTLGEGGLSYLHSIAQLPAITIPAGGCITIGGPDCSGGACTSALDFEPDYLNSSAGNARGVALLYGVASSITSSSVPVDAVIYGDANTGMLLDETGAVGAIDSGFATTGHSIARSASGTWADLATPTPGTCAAFTPP